jgi:hypothetical protein
MNRFRFTFIAVCLVLLYLGISDLRLWYNNQAPHTITIEALESSGPPQEWLHVVGGYQDLDRAINTSGTVEIEALLVPLLTDPEQPMIRVLVETHNPHLIQLFKEYHLFTDTLPEKKAFREQYAAAFKGQRDILGMLSGGLIASGNQQKLLNLAKDTGLDVDENVIFLSEGKKPGRWRGLFFTVIGGLGLLRVCRRKKNPATDPKEPGLSA